MTQIYGSQLQAHVQQQPDEAHPNLNPTAVPVAGSYLRHRDCDIFKVSPAFLSQPGIRR